jgi:hypothetical protein
MTATRLVVIPYEPRNAFESYHAAPHRYCLTVAHRRAGKTVARINKLIRAAATARTEAPRFGYLAPYYIQAKDIAWAYLKRYTAPMQPRVNESELSVTLAHNNAQIRLYGAENAERLRGLYFDGIVVDEAQDISPGVITQVILPALSDRQGWLDISGTPKGWGNLLGEAYKRAQNDSDWFVQVLKASDTGILPAEELSRLARSMPENEYQQEFECSFEAAITGAYYARELQIAETEGRITRVPHDHSLLVHTAWDLGMSDSMSIWFFQTIGREIRVIDYLESSGYGLDYYAARLRERAYNYGTHYGPHDLKVRELGTGKSRYEVARNLGITFNVVRDIGIKDGIDAGRMLVARCWFDAAKCATGLNALRQYRERVDEKRQIAMGPLHDWTSHAADAFRYLAVGLQEPKAAKVEAEEDEFAWSGGYAQSWMG